MAKQKVEQYIFQNGIPLSGNRFPQSYELIKNNVEFILEEINAWIDYKIVNAQRYTPTNAVYTPGTGVLVLTIGTHKFEVGDYVRFEPGAITFTCGLDNHATLHPYPRGTGVPNTVGTDPYFSKPAKITSLTSTTITLNVGISSNTSEHTFVSAVANGVIDNFVDYTNDSKSKCKRDAKYNLVGLDGDTGGMLYDLRYGGNTQTRYMASKYWINSTPQIDGDRTVEISAKEFMARMINNYILPQSSYTSLRNLSYTPTNAVYTPTTGELVLTLGAHGFVVGEKVRFLPGALTFTCGMDNFATLHPYPRGAGVPNASGTDPYFAQSATVTAKDSTTITLNVGISSNTSVHNFVSALPNSVIGDNQTQVQYFNNANTYETGTEDRINALTFIITDVIENGLDNVPTLDRAKISSVRMQTRVPTNDLMLITDTTVNEVLFNFSDPTLGGSVSYQVDDAELLTKGVSDDFPKFLERTGTITTVYLTKDTDNRVYSPNAVALLEANLEFIKKETVAWIANHVGLAEEGSMWYGYTYNTAKCERDMGLNVEGITHDIKYGGNEKSRYNASKYWVQTTPQIDGDRTPEIAAKNFARDLINNYIFKGLLYPTQQNNGVTQNTILPIAELGVTTRVTELFGIITDVIANGLTVLPVEVKTPLYDASDNLQIFIDQGELRVRPYDFGTDAIERMRVSNSVSMLDADFEYGLQPTKWQAIAMQRGYPSIYEIPGTDKEVLSVSTDASSGTGGVGQSLITVTTVGAHGITSGTPITIKALENSVAGASRAEGSFIISTVPTNNTFTYYAKSKVGTTNGQVLSTYYTQLREAGFYTGAAIGAPIFSVLSQGSAGIFTNPLAAPAGSSIISFDGQVAEIGAPVVNETGMINSINTFSAADALRPAGTYGPITGTTNSIVADVVVGTFTITIDGTGNVIESSVVTGGRRNQVGDTITIADSDLGNNGAADLTFLVASVRNGTGIGEGAQVTSVEGTGGVITTLTTVGDYNAGVNQIQVGSVAGINQGQAIDRGDGTAIHVTTVVGNLINFDGNTSSAIVGNTATYTNITGTNYQSSGFGASFDITRAAGVYTVNINTAGSGFSVSDVLVIQGDSVGGIAGINDIRITVDTVDGTGAIQTFTSTGTAFDGNATFVNQSGVNTNGQGSGSIFDVTYTNNAYSAVLAAPTYSDLGVGIVQGGSGTGAVWDVTLSTNNYTVQQSVSSASSGYIVGDVIRLSGSFFGGSSPGNDLDITVTNISAVTGEITGFSTSGSGPDASANFPAVNFSTSSIGTGAEINVSFIGSTYSVNVPDGGSGYSQGDTLIVDGSDLGGVTSTNDATITIDAVGGSGEILAASASGTAINSASYTDISSGVNVTGAGATFTVVQNFNATYTVTVGVTGGADYASGNTIIITGDNVGGQTPANDITITVSSVDAAGSITGVTHTGTAAGVTQNYAVGDRLKIFGTTLLGTDVTHDATIEITAVGAGGSISTFTISGTAPDASESYIQVPYTYNGAAGSTAEFTISRLGTVYSLNITGPGVGYLATETFTVAGTNLGGASPANNATITVQTIGASGEILTASISGTAANTKTITGVSQADGEIIALQGTLATFDITLTNGVYSAVVNAPGQDYFVNQSIVFLGTTLSGASPTNDLTITITSVNGTGGVTGLSVAGTGATGTGSYTGLGALNLPNFGQNAVFSVTRNNGIYAVPVITNDGSSYQVGNKISVAGTSLGGSTPANDAIITITDVSTDGSIVDSTITGTAIQGTTVQTYSTVTMSELLTATVPANTTVAFAALATVEVTFNTAHGLVPGDAFITTVGSDDGINNHTLLEGPFFAQQVPTATTLRYQCRAPGAIGDVNNITATLYPRPDSFFIHRPYDGGVMLGTGGPQHGAQAIRQSKKYIRYQSGKGIMYTTGALFAPSYDLLEVTADGTTAGSFITVTTDDVDHGLQIGGKIKLIGIETNGYNGEYEVASIVSERIFRVIATTLLGNTNPVLSARSQVSLLNWHGATVRSGTFDDQNGIFQEYDGVNFNAVQRTATLQLAGTVQLGVDSNLVTGTGTRFRDQLKAGDVIVIKGMTHVVSSVTDQTTMTVTPDFRGVTPASGAKLCKVEDKKTKQADFNKDTLDGLGSSGYIMDISKMQMIGIQYSWYGAGFIDWMLRGDDGNFIFYHRMRNSNINTEAYMRTGNMPVRYEVGNYGPNDRLAADITATQTTIPLIDASFFPPTGGTVYIDNEMIRFTGITGDTLTGCTRSAPMCNYAAGATRTYTAGPAATHTERTGVILISNTISPIISHWGSAFQTDGGFDSDRGYLFSYTSTGNEISGTRNTVFMLRLAPSVSNAITGDLGERELLNRAQLLLEGIEITSDGVDPANNANVVTGGIVVEGILNPQNYPTDPGSVGWTGLTGAAQGGQPSFAQVAPGGGVTWTTGATQTTATAVIQAAMTDTAAALYGRSNTNYHYVATAQWEALGGKVGVGTTVTGIFPAGTTIIEVVNEYWYGRYRFRTSQRNSTTIQAGQNYTFQYGGSTSNSSTLLFVKASWEALGAVAGTEVDPADTKFPPGTYVASVSIDEFGGTEYYQIGFTQSSTTTINPGDTVSFLFGQPPYAQPGETVFSFIATPGESSMLDLSSLKELTNTTLGGRGTFPNGPDVLAINVYKTGGISTKANIILRWSEAQA